MATKKKNDLAPSITLAELTTAYTKHMEGAGKSRGTVFSYESELRLAQRELGADIRIGAITRDDITVFNNAKRVVELKNGGPKSQLSIDKTRRVLRLALRWAQDTNLIASSPAEPIEIPPDVATITTPKARKPRKKREAITLEVTQPEAEAAADAAEAMLATTNDESAA